MMSMSESEKKIFWRSFSNSKGQVAIFVALVFQILFLFFAMVINVGLLVHHKINLQNSVDMAAYYGAMKQAENLNAMAHINYQVRQSWKLLSFRYRIFGTAGEYKKGASISQQIHPFNKEAYVNGATPLRQPQDIVLPEHAKSLYVTAPPFCITYTPWASAERSTKNENNCQKIDSGEQTIPLFDQVPIIAGFQGFTRAISAATNRLRLAAQAGCADFGSFNYITLGRFVAAFNEDQRAKMESLRMMSQSMSQSPDTFMDIDGDDVKTGIENTLKNNLTAPNADSLGNVQVFNSLGHPNCSKPGFGQWPHWLSPVKIFPGFFYVDTRCNSKAVVTFVKELSNADQNKPEMRAQTGFVDQIEQLASILGVNTSDPFNKYNLSLGVEKNPWCMAYVGVKASTAPKIPFSPFGSVKLQAKAFAKPFGGRMGPWYGKTWAKGQPASSFSVGAPSTRLDPHVPPRIIDQQILGSVQDPTRLANFSRYVGDPYGLKSRLPAAYFGQAIFRMRNPWNNTGFNEIPQYEHWSHLPSYTDGGAMDLLAWDSDGKRAPTVRKIELNGILPDLFDTTYYSIEPDYFNNYYKRLKSGWGAKAGFEADLRPDIGYRGDGPDELKNFSVKDQFKYVEDETLTKQLFLDITKDFSYILTDWRNTLTSWVSVGMGDYTQDTSRFGKCQTEITKGMEPTPSNCAVAGGTTGYGVKIVSPRFLKANDLSLGGPTTSNSVENPPPDGW